MTEPSADHLVSLSTSGYEDGLGRRTLIFDRECGAMLECLHLRPELAAFEKALRDRNDLLSAFKDDRLAPVRRIERASDSTTLTIISELVSGNRLSDLLEGCAGQPRDESASPGVDVAMGLLLEVLPALGALHSVTGLSHGAVGPGRVIVRPDGQVVLLDGSFAQALERLNYSRQRLWMTFGLAMVPSAGPSRFDVAADIGQAALIGVMLTLGRPLRENEYPGGLAAALAEVVEIAQIRGSQAFADGLQQFFQRTLPLPGREPYASADEAALELGQVAREIGIARCRLALAVFVRDMNAALGRDHGDIETTEPDVVAAPGRPVAPLRLVPSVVLEPENGDPFGAPIELDAALAPSLDIDPLTPVEPPLDAAVLLMTEDPTWTLDPVIESADAAVAEPVAIYHSQSATIGETDCELEPASISNAEPAAESAPLVAGEWAPAHEPELVAAEPTSEYEPEWRFEPEPSADTQAEPAPAPEPVSEVDAFAYLEPEPAYEPERSVPTQAAPEPYYAAIPDPEPAHDPEPDLNVDELSPVAAEGPASAAPPPAAPSRRQKRGSKRKRDKLRSIAVPVSAPAPMPPPLSVPVMPAPIAAPAAWQPPPMPSPSKPAPSHTIAAAPATVGVRLKTSEPTGYNPPAPLRPSHRDAQDVADISHGHRGPRKSARSFPWKLAAAAVVVIAAGVAGGRAYLVDGRAAAPAVAAAPAAATVVAKATGSLEVASVPTGVKTLLDGDPVGETPLTIDAVTVGKHALTFITSSGTVRRVVQIEAGKSLSVDVPVYAGWVAVFAPIPLDIAEKGRAIGTTEQGRLMLAPGRHSLTLTNQQLGYRTERTVDIEPGEERAITVQPTGTVSINAVPWAEVWIDGQKAGETPMANFQLPLGTREIVFRHPELGERRLTATVTASQPLALSVDFNKAPEL